jgi:hypothetical protein
VGGKEGGKEGGKARKKSYLDHQPPKVQRPGAQEEEEKVEESREDQRAGRHRHGFLNAALKGDKNLFLKLMSVSVTSFQRGTLGGREGRREGGQGGGMEDV